MDGTTHGAATRLFRRPKKRVSETDFHVSEEGDRGPGFLGGISPPPRAPLLRIRGATEGLEISQQEAEEGRPGGKDRGIRGFPGKAGRLELARSSHALLNRTIKVSHNPRGHSQRCSQTGKECLRLQVRGSSEKARLAHSLPSLVSSFVFDAPRGHARLCPPREKGRPPG